MCTASLKSSINGLFISGRIAGRFKRKAGEKSEVIIYRIDDNTNIYYVSHWNPDTYYETGDNVCFPVTAKTYIKNSKCYISYSVRKDIFIGEKF